MNRKEMYKLAEGTPFFPSNLTSKQTVSLLYDPRRDRRVDVNLFDGKRLTYEGIQFLKENNIHGYKNIPIEQAQQILIESKQFYRQH